MKKYRTKSGKVEEKLPGVNATVNPSEKAQIAMAGGADTLKDVQTILGQEGKRNNLKGQGAKHLVSFAFSEGPEGYGSSASGFSEGPEGYGPSASGFAPSDIGDSYAPDFGYGGEPGGVAEPDNQLGRPPGGVAQSGFAPIEYPTRQHLPSYKKAGNKTYFQDEEFWQDKEQKDWDKANPDPSLFDKAKRAVESSFPTSNLGFYNIDNLRKANLADTGVSVLGAIAGVVTAPMAAVAAAKGMAVEAYLSGLQKPGKFDMDPIAGLTGKDAEAYADLYTDPPPPPDDPGSDSGDEAPKKKKKKPISYADNKVTLAVTSPTRAQLRRRSTRFA